MEGCVFLLFHMLFLSCYQRWGAGFYQESATHQSCPVTATHCRVAATGKWERKCFPREIRPHSYGRVGQRKYSHMFLFESRSSSDNLIMNYWVTNMTNIALRCTAWVTIGLQILSTSNAYMYTVDIFFLSNLHHASFGMWSSQVLWCIQRVNLQLTAELARSESKWRVIKSVPEEKRVFPTLCLSLECFG